MASLTRPWNYVSTPILESGEFSIAEHRQKRDKQNNASRYRHRDGKTSFQVFKRTDAGAD